MSTVDGTTQSAKNVLKLMLGHSALHTSDRLTSGMEMSEACLCSTLGCASPRGAILGWKGAALGLRKGSHEGIVPNGTVVSGLHQRASCAA